MEVLKAREGYVLDYAEPHYREDEDGNLIEEHLQAKIIYLSIFDSADNYKEVEIEK